MSLFVASLNSGSNGNCYYIANDHEAVLIDAGISCREVERRMRRLGLAMEKLKAVFISHEHSDHIKGVEVLSKKYGLPVYITALTQQHGGLYLNAALTRTFLAYQAVKVGGLDITAFPKLHDCAEPHSFVVSGNGVTVGVFTDIGSACHHVVRNFKVCHAVFLEANYDDEMLENGHYPFYLKKRIRSGAGHLSNRQALDLFTRHRPEFLTHIFLSHLSRDNNDPHLVKQLFEEHANGVLIRVASRDAETELYHIGGEAQRNVKLQAVGAVQTTLF